MVSSDNKKSAFEETMDGLLDTVVKKTEEIGMPLFEQAAEIFNEADARISASFDALSKGEEIPEEVEVPKHEGLPDFEAHSKVWDQQFDQIVRNELGQYKVCPNCQKVVPSSFNFCDNCGTKLPELSAAFRICPKCGAKNDALVFYCSQCGEPMPLIPETEEKQ